MNDPQPQPYRQEIQAVIDAFAGAAGTQNQLEAFIDLWIKATVFARSIRQIAVANVRSNADAALDPEMQKDAYALWQHSNAVHRWFEQCYEDLTKIKPGAEGGTPPAESSNVH